MLKEMLLLLLADLVEAGAFPTSLEAFAAFEDESFSAFDADFSAFVDDVFPDLVGLAVAAVVVVEVVVAEVVALAAVELFAAVAVVVVASTGALHSQVSPTCCGNRSHNASEINPAIPWLCSVPQGIEVGGLVLNETSASGLPTSFPSPQMLHAVMQRDNSAKRTRMRGGFIMLHG